jgi:hypothetical protein
LPRPVKDEEMRSLTSRRVPLMFVHGIHRCCPSTNPIRCSLLARK